MNGHLYDPATGRFLSADPTIQYADDMQNYNRYSYNHHHHHPLSTTDRSGYGFFKSIGKLFKGVAKAIVRFLETHSPLPHDVVLSDASFWTAAQAAFLREEIAKDADWAEVIDALNAALHANSD